MSLLSKVVSGKIEKPHYVLLYGEPGLGKSTFASHAPSPIFLCTEDGTNNLDVSRLKIDSFTEMLSAVDELATTKHSYKTIVIDTIDHFEPMIFSEVLKENPKYNNIEKIPYKNGYEYALTYWLKFLSVIEKARENGLHIIFLAHEYVKSHNDPMLTESYDKHKIKIHHKAASLLVDKVENVLFVTQKVYLDSSDSGKKAKAYGEGNRVVYTENRPSFVAKNRFNLPFEIPLSWEDFERECKAQKPKDAASMIKYIEENIINLDSSIREQAIEHFEKNKTNPVVLAQIEDRIKAIISTKTA